MCIRDRGTGCIPVCAECYSVSDPVCRSVRRYCTGPVSYTHLNRTDVLEGENMISEYLGIDSDYIVIGLAALVLIPVSYTHLL